MNLPAPGCKCGRQMTRMHDGQTYACPRCDHAPIQSMIPPPKKPGNRATRPEGAPE